LDILLPFPFIALPTIPLPDTVVGADVLISRSDEPLSRASRLSSTKSQAE